MLCDLCCRRTQCYPRHGLNSTEKLQQLCAVLAPCRAAPPRLPPNLGSAAPVLVWPSSIFITILNAPNVNENMIMFLFQTYGLLTLIGR